MATCEHGQSVDLCLRPVTGNASPASCERTRIVGQGASGS